MDGRPSLASVLLADTPAVFVHEVAGARGLQQLDGQPGGSPRYCASDSA